MSADPYRHKSNQDLEAHGREWADLPVMQVGPIATPEGHPEYRLDGYLAQEGIDLEDAS